MWLISPSWAMYPYMVLMGLSTGFGSATVAALQVEFFGQKYIGTVRSLFTSMMVLSSAVGPALFGVILDAGWGFETVFPVTIVMLILVILQSLRSIPAYSRAKWKFKFKRIKRNFRKK
ncbi:MFS transporter [Mongoliibacter sp.]|uniref:MFS transporter n=1 Tax=Mongoliibacter sp. TaxID=2022438 RepID=UPI00345C177E